MAIEEAAYISILNDEIFEIREYESHVLAEIESMEVLRKPVVKHLVSCFVIFLVKYTPEKIR